MDEEEEIRWLNESYGKYIFPDTDRILGRLERLPGEFTRVDVVDRGEDEELPPILDVKEIPAMALKDEILSRIDDQLYQISGQTLVDQKKMVDYLLDLRNIANKNRSHKKKTGG